MKKRLKKLSIPTILLLAAFIGGFAGALSSILPLPKPKPTLDANISSETTQFRGRVIKVSDGDSITVRTDGGNIRVRLAEIDAPERGQPWGEQSKRVLTAAVANKEVVVITQGQDRYGRTLGRVLSEGKNINLDMVAQGAAWAYPDYVRDPKISRSELQARNARAGLWALNAADREPPWDYRAHQRDTAAIAVGR